jgi:hypothetical protein
LVAPVAGCTANQKCHDLHVDTTRSPTLAVTLSVLPASTLSLAQLPQLQLVFVIRNTSSSMVDPRLEESTLFVDGKPVEAWARIVSNGPRDERWNALPPGQELQFSYLLGDALFATPGLHQVELEVSNVRSARVPIQLR